MNYLIGKTNKTTKISTLNQKGYKIPALGEVATGIPIEAIEDVLDYEEIPASWENQGEFFALRINGDSMKTRMEIGDVVIVKQQTTAPNIRKSSRIKTKVLKRK